MRTLSRLFVVALLAACARVEESPPPPATPPAPTLADFAGTWNNTATLTGVANPVPSVMTGTADPETWSVKLEGRPPNKLTVSIVGDSLIGQTGEYDSILRTGVKVSTRTAVVLKDGMLMGTVVATYKTPAGDEVVHGTMHGTRVP